MIRKHGLVSARGQVRPEVRSGQVWSGLVRPERTRLCCVMLLTSNGLGPVVTNDPKYPIVNEKRSAPMAVLSLSWQNQKRFLSFYSNEEDIISRVRIQAKKHGCGRFLQRELTDRAAA